jgi:hypothetical protein
MDRQQPIETLVADCTENYRSIQKRGNAQTVECPLKLKVHRINHRSTTLLKIHLKIKDAEMHSNLDQGNL